MEKRKCRSCLKEVIWVITESGKRMPIDADSIKKRVVLNGDLTKAAVRNVGTSHFETCPDALKHRKNK